MTKAQRWHNEVRDRAFGFCQAVRHDQRCRLQGEHAHHICYRSQIPKTCYWIVENGAWLSDLCHTLAHKTHNGNLDEQRTRIAVDAVNAAIPSHKPELRVPYFERRIA